MYGMFKFDAAIGGARRDEEKARAKERFNRPCVTAIFLRFSEYLIFRWLSTRWTWLISVKMYMIRLLPTTRRYRPAKAKAFGFLKLLPLQGVWGLLAKLELYYFPEKVTSQSSMPACQPLPGRCHELHRRATMTSRSWLTSLLHLRLYKP